LVMRERQVVWFPRLHHDIIFYAKRLNALCVCLTTKSSVFYNPSCAPFDVEFGNHGSNTKPYDKDSTLDRP